MKGTCKGVALSLVLEGKAYHLEPSDLSVELYTVGHLLAKLVLVEVRVAVGQFQFKHAAG